MDIKEQLLTVRSRAKAFLHLAYDIVKGNTGEFFTFSDLATTLGVEDYDAIETNLRRNSWITYEAGSAEIVYLTYKGLIEAEEDILSGNLLVVKDKKGKIVKATPQQRNQAQLDMRERRRKLSNFLSILYEKTSGDVNTDVMLEEVVQDVGLAHEEIEYIVQHLSAGGLIAQLTTGGIIAITELGIERVEEAILGNQKEESATKKKRGMNTDTIAKLKALMELRKKYIVGDNVSIARSEACGQVGLDPRTLSNNVLELHVHWYEAHYKFNFEWQN